MIWYNMIWYGNDRHGGALVLAAHWDEEEWPVDSSESDIEENGLGGSSNISGFRSGIVNAIGTETGTGTGTGTGRINSSGSVTESSIHSDGRDGSGNLVIDI